MRNEFTHLPNAVILGTLTLLGTAGTTDTTGTDTAAPNEGADAMARKKMLSAESAKSEF
jgi:hypothetical protein